MVSDERICIRRAELSDARIRSRKLYRQRWYQTHGRYWLQVSDARRYPAGEVSDARRYQTRGEADRVQGRTWEGGKGEEDR